MPNDPQQAMEFAQSKGQARKEGRTNVRFTDVAGIAPILAELQDVVKVFAPLSAPLSASFLCLLARRFACFPSSPPSACSLFL